MVVFGTKGCIFRSPSSGLIEFKTPELFQHTGSDSLLQLVLKLYGIIGSPIMYSLLVVLAVKIVECIESSEMEPIGAQKYKFDLLFKKLERISKGIRPKEEAKEAPKQEDEKKKVTGKPSPSTSWIHSTSFNLLIL